MQESKRAFLIRRAQMLQRVRSFFAQRAVVEVDPPLMQRAASVDLHIDPIVARCMNQPSFLHTSPEYTMKRLLAAGSGDIFYLGHVFRDEECSPLHQPEFTMAEWYRQGFSFQEMIDETIALIELFLGQQSVIQKTYRQLFLEAIGIDIAFASDEELLHYLIQSDILPYKGVEEEGRDALLNLLLGTVVQPYLDSLPLFVLTHYPASQAALAKRIVEEDFETALRFEIYYRGVELANGYHELIDPVEQYARLVEANEQRIAFNKTALPIDMAFIEALHHGVPECSGVALGIDRLFMIESKATSIEQILPLAW